MLTKCQCQLSSTPDTYYEPSTTQVITGQNICKNAVDGFTIRKPKASHSRLPVREKTAFKSRGRHTITRKRHGIAEARMPTAVLWMRRMRVLRRLLRKYMHVLYMKAKGNVLENKRVLLEYIHKAKAEKVRSKLNADPPDAQRLKAKGARRRRHQRFKSGWRLFSVERRRLPHKAVACVIDSVPAMRV
ncbi:60S ribosomal protein L19, partial [Rhizophlyctis rosea]